MSWRTGRYGACCLCLLLTSPGWAQTIFSALPKASGVPVAPRLLARSYIFCDFDNDGWPDQLRAEGLGSFRVVLLHNEGGRRFAEYSHHLEAPDLPVGFRGGGSSVADFDNDGDLDLFVPNGSFWNFGKVRNGLLRNDRGVLCDVAQEAGLNDEFPTDNAIWLDFDRDGWVDLYTGNLSCGDNDPAVNNKLYRNNGDGTFADFTREAGLEVVFNDIEGGCGRGSNGGMAGADFSGDGWPDLYVAVFEDVNRLFVNDGQGHFQDATTGEIADPGQAFQITVGDVDNDLDLDIFMAAGGTSGQYRSQALLNLGKAQFLDVTEGLGLAPLLAVNVQGIGMGDVDNDGDLDLVTAGPPTFFLNNGDGTFTQSNARAGVDGKVVEFPTTFGDFDRDGFLDGLNWDGVMRNNGSGNHYLRVELVGIRSNRSGIGAQVLATSGDLRQLREILGGTGYKQDELVAHFGLGEQTKVDRLEVRWPSGQVDVHTDIPADQQIRLFEGREGYHPALPITWEHNLPDSVAAGRRLKAELVVRPALYEPGARLARVSADLSSLGGPAELPLSAQGDGAYTLETELEVTSSPGLKEVAVEIEQETSLGPYWSRLLATVAVQPVAPLEDLVIFAEGLENGWQLEGVNTDVEIREGDPAYQGRKFIAIDIKRTDESGNGYVRFVGPEGGVNSGAYRAIRLAFRPAKSSPGQFPNWNWFAQANHNPLRMVALEVTGAAWTLSSAGINSGLTQWQVVEIPLEMFAIRGPLHSFWIGGGNFFGEAYLDEVRLVAAVPLTPTIVEEERTASLPHSFSLAQNFPNPFNSSTVIRFELPESGEVELAVFNLAGQQVAALVQGPREAGNYTLRWDGRDERGKELASGVYLYRLRVGERVDTRKLVLVR